MPDHATSQLLLKVNEALLLAQDENDILACVALHVDDSATLRLIYLEQHTSNRTFEVVRVTASWRANRLWLEDPLLRQSMAEQGTTDPMLVRILYDAANLKEQIWFIPELRAAYAVPETPFSDGIHALALVKLYSVDAAHGTLWSAALCISWPASHYHTAEESYALSVLSQTVSAVIANRRKYVHTATNLERLREVDRLKTQFLYMVSHELRTPLSGIIATADGLLHGTCGDLPDLALTDISRIEAAGQHLLRVIADLLDIARIEAGQLNLHLENVAVKPIINDVIRETASLIRRRDLRVVAELADTLPAVRADMTRVRQVLLNLVTNAVKYSEKGVIHIGATVSDDKLVLSVADEGVGIDPARHATIFEPFQPGNGQGDRGGGSGVGLSICKKLVELHGGRIWLESTPGQGATFSISLPVAQPDAKS